MKNIISLFVLVGIFKAGECVISAWSKPHIISATGSGTLVEKINNGVTSGTATGITITATSDGTVSAYTLESQTPDSPDLDIDNNGVVTVSSGTIDYSTAASFTLVVTANDGAAVTATITLLVNAAPSFSSHNNRPCIADGATTGTDLIDLTATDANSGDTITYAIASGNPTNDFTITNTGTVKVATGKTLNMTATSSYTLVITATDNSSTPLTATTTVTATVSITCSAGADSGAAALAVTFMTVLLTLIVSLQ